MQSLLLWIPTNVFTSHTPKKRKPQNADIVLATTISMTRDWSKSLISITFSFKIFSTDYRFPHQWVVIKAPKWWTSWGCGALPSCTDHPFSGRVLHPVSMCGIFPPPYSSVTPPGYPTCNSILTPCSIKWCQIPHSKGSSPTRLFLTFRWW